MWTSVQGILVVEMLTVLTALEAIPVYVKLPTLEILTKDVLVSSHIFVDILMLSVLNFRFYILNMITLNW